MERRQLNKCCWIKRDEEEKYYFLKGKLIALGKWLER